MSNTDTFLPNGPTAMETPAVGPPSPPGPQRASPEQVERIRLKEAWGLSPARIAKEEGLPTREVREIIKGSGGDWATLRDRVREKIVQRCYEKAAGLLEHITIDKAEKESNPRVAVTMAILIDKARLLEGMPTSIVGEIEVDVAKLMQPELLRQLIAMKGGLDQLKPEHRALALRLGVGEDP